MLQKAKKKLPTVSEIVINRMISSGSNELQAKLVTGVRRWAHVTIAIFENNIGWVPADRYIRDFYGGKWKLLKLFELVKLRVFLRGALNHYTTQVFSKSPIVTSFFNYLFTYIIVLLGIFFKFFSC